MIYWIALAFWILFIAYCGTRRFGRAQSQQWIDTVKQKPRLWKFLDAYHGQFRAAFHYLEFGGLFLLLYLALSQGHLHWAPARGYATWAISCVIAVLDEWHQSRTAGRCFRRIDLLHSFLGATLPMLGVAILGH